MDHIGDRADSVDSVEALYSLRAVRKSDSDRIPLSYADGAKRLGALLDIVEQLLIGRARAHKVKSDVIRIFLCDQLYGAEHRSLVILKMRGHIAEIFDPRRLCGNCFTHQKLTSSFAGVSRSSGSSSSFLRSLMVFE